MNRALGIVFWTLVVGIVGTFGMSIREAVHASKAAEKATINQVVPVPALDLGAPASCGTQGEPCPTSK